MGRDYRTFRRGSGRFVLPPTGCKTEFICSVGWTRADENPLPLGLRDSILYETTKARQKGGASVYKLSDEALAKIEAVLRRRATVEDLEQDDSEEEDLDTDHKDPDAESEEGCASE